MTAISLEGKTAIVTGGGRGIGKATTRRLAEAGANVAIASRKLPVLEATAAEFASLPGRVIAVECHVGRMEQLANLVARTEAELGPIDILVNNSATNIHTGPGLEATDDMFDKMVEINLKSCFRLVNLVAPKMMSRGQGSIINIASISGMRPQRGGLLYSMTKAALIMLTRSWAREFGPHGVRVNAIAPGLIQTEFSRYFWEDPQRMADLVGRQPIGRVGQPEEIGYAALYLASSEASYLTGQVLVIDGGATA
jgi:NAD(P)-dependent dehydrogenase (short-subunit alcohol dehydrogenase family)